MALAIVPYTRELEPAVRAFNERLRLAGVGYQFPAWTPQTAVSGDAVVDRGFVAVRDGDTVHGGYLIKEREYWLAGGEARVGFLGLPLSEGVIDRRFSTLGIQLITHALKRQPLLFGLGIGGREESFARVVGALGWTLDPVPFMFRIARPFRVARGLVALRRSAARRWLGDVAAWSGLASIAVRVLQRSSGPRPGFESVSAQSGTASSKELFSAADSTWERCRGAFRLAAWRDANVLARLYASGDKPYLPFVVRGAAAQTAWAVALDTQMRQHKYFGNLRVGTIVDCFGDPAAAVSLIADVSRALTKRGVDVILSNQSADVWTDAFRANGYLTRPSNFFFAASPALAKLLGPLDRLGALHLTRGDGEGPSNL